jgi:hypothetical protein
LIKWCTINRKTKKIKNNYKWNSSCLTKKFDDPDNSFLGYWNDHLRVNEKYGVDVKYRRIRKYLKQQINTKLKSPRKSHYKKDEEAEKS